MTLKISFKRMKFIWFIRYTFTFCTFVQVLKIQLQFFKRVLLKFNLRRPKFFNLGYFLLLESNFNYANFITIPENVKHVFPNILNKIMLSFIWTFYIIFLHNAFFCSYKWLVTKYFYPKFLCALYIFSIFFKFWDESIKKPPTFI